MAHIRILSWGWLIGLLASLLPAPAALAQPAQGWEYRSLALSAISLSDLGADLIAQLDRQGAAGWEASAVLDNQLVLRRPIGGGIVWEHQALDLTPSLLAGELRGLGQQLSLLEAAGWEASLLVGPYLLLKRPAWGGGPWEHVIIEALSLLSSGDPQAAGLRLSAFGAQGWEFTLIVGDYLLFKRPAQSALRFTYLRDDSAASLGPGAGAGHLQLAALGAQGWELVGSAGQALLLRREDSSPQAWEYQGLEVGATLSEQLSDLGALGYAPALTHEGLLVLKRPGPALAPTPAPTLTPTLAPTPAPTRTSAPSHTPGPTQQAERTPALTPTTHHPASTTPVVLVPGYQACSEAILGSRPRWELAEDASADDLARTALLPVVAEQLGYGQLVRAMLAAGMQLGSDLFIACPSWAESLPTAAERLAETVQWAAAARSDDPPVTILSHGEGGLVARYYLQQSAAASRALVGDLIMLAPPNQGLVSSYYLWEGGDLSHKPAGDRWLDSFALTARCLWPGSAAAEQLTPEQTARCVRTGTLDPTFEASPASNEILLHGWLIADSPFLDDGSGQRGYPSPPIERLNAPEQIQALFSGLQGSVTILAGAIERSTIASLPIVARPSADSPLWRYGQPDPARMPELASGDGWVLLESTRLPITPRERYRHQVIWGVDHRGLLGDPQVYELLSAQLGLRLTPEPAAAEGLDLLLAVAWSPVELMLSDPQGRAIGPDAAGQLRRELPNAYYGVSPGGPQFVLVPRAASGRYRLDVYSREERPYLLQVAAGVRDQPLLLARGKAQAGQARTFLVDYRPAAPAQPFAYMLALQILAALIVGLAVVLLALTSRRPLK
jgi:hypothetical protein